MRKKLITGLIAAVVCFAALGMTACGGGDTQGEEAKGVVIAGSTSVQPLSEVLAEEFLKTDGGVEVDVQGGGSGQGIKAIDEKIADIGSLSRDLKEEEKASAAEEFTIAKDGIAVVLNKDVKVDDLTIEQIKGIYTGEVKNWKEVGGADKEITVVSREAGSGTRGAFTEITGVLVKDDAGNEVDKTKSDALVQPSTGAVLETVAKTPDSIGYVSLGSLDDTVKVATVEKVEATVENVLSNKYAIQRPFIYIVGEDVSDSAKAFIDYAMSEEGQKIVEENGFIPVI